MHVAQPRPVALAFEPLTAPWRAGRAGALRHAVSASQQTQHAAADTEASDTAAVYERVDSSLWRQRQTDTRSASAGTRRKAAVAEPAQKAREMRRRSRSLDSSQGAGERGGGGSGARHSNSAVLPARVGRMSTGEPGSTSDVRNETLDGESGRRGKGNGKGLTLMVERKGTYRPPPERRGPLGRLAEAIGVVGVERRQLPPTWERLRRSEEWQARQRRREALQERESVERSMRQAAAQGIAGPGSPLPGQRGATAAGAQAQMHGIAAGTRVHGGRDKLGMPLDIPGGSDTGLQVPHGHPEAVGDRAAGVPAGAVASSAAAAWGIGEQVRPEVQREEVRRRLQERWQQEARAQAAAQAEAQQQHAARVASQRRAVAQRRAAAWQQPDWQAPAAREGQADAQHSAPSGTTESETEHRINSQQGADPPTLAAQPAQSSGAESPVRGAAAGAPERRAAGGTASAGHASAPEQRGPPAQSSNTPASSAVVRTSAASGSAGGGAGDGVETDSGSVHGEAPVAAHGGGVGGEPNAQQYVVVERYTPRNASHAFSGKATARTAIVQSLNAPTVALAYEVGLQNGAFPLQPLLVSSVWTLA